MELSFVSWGVAVALPGLEVVDEAVKGERACCGAEEDRGAALDPRRRAGSEAVAVEPYPNLE
jgi:hypothetical protein